MRADLRRDFARNQPSGRRAASPATPLALALVILFAALAHHAIAAPEPAPVSSTLPAGVPPAVIADPASDPQWRELFHVLAEPKARVSRFEERRYFPFRQQPVVLQGEIRMSPGHGLSLHYFTPKPLTVIVDRAGVLMRDEHGRERSAPDDRRAQAATAGLSEVLQFDLPKLTRDFEVHGRRDAAGWTLGFVPRDPKLGRLVGAVVVHGTDHRVDRIEIIRSDRQRIEILIRNTLDDVIFPPDVLQQYFR